MGENNVKNSISFCYKTKLGPLIDLPMGQKVIKCKWVYHIKIFAQGKISKYKVKVVTKGFSQTFNIDYNDTFSPIVKYDSMWGVLTIVANKDFDIIQFEIKTTFLYADLNEEIYTCVSLKG